MLKRSFLGAAGCAAALLILMAPSVAMADGGANLIAGPIMVNHGYTVQVNGYSCGTPYSGGSVLFTKTVGKAVETHTYFSVGKGKATCTMASNLSNGSLKIDLGKFGKVDLTFKKHGKSGSQPPPPGCSGNRTKTQQAEATGTLKVSLAKNFFGKVDKTKVSGTIAGNPTYRCHSQTKGDWFSATFGSHEGSPSVYAFRPHKGKTTLTAVENQALGKSVQATHSIVVTGPGSLFSPSSNLRTATLQASESILSGKFKFKATQCNAQSHAWQGSVAGSLKVHFDALGTKTLKNPSSALVGNEAGTAC